MWLVHKGVRTISAASNITAKKSLKLMFSPAVPAVATNDLRKPNHTWLQIAHKRAQLARLISSLSPVSLSLAAWQRELQCQTLPVILKFLNYSEMWHPLRPTLGCPAREKCRCCRDCSTHLAQYSTRFVCEVFSALAQRDSYSLIVAASGGFMSHSVRTTL